MARMRFLVSNYSEQEMHQCALVAQVFKNVLMIPCRSFCVSQYRNNKMYRSEVETRCYLLHCRRITSEDSHRNKNCDEL
jgi:hypothetical protein